MPSDHGREATLANMHSPTNDLQAVARQLLANESAVLALVEIIPDAVIIHRNGKIIFCNSAAVSLLGADDAAGLIGMEPSRIIHPDDRWRLRERRKLALEQGGRLGPEPRKVVRLDGKTVHCETSATILDVDGDTVFLVVLRDVSKRMAAEETLRENEEIYRDLYENAPNAYVSVDPEDGLVRGFNRALVDLLDYTEDELSDMKVFEFYADTPEGLPKANALFAELKQGNPIVDQEMQMRSKNGELIWVSLSVSQRRDETGRVVENRSMVTNITARKEAEETLRENEKSLRLITDNLPIHISFVGKDRRYLFINKAYERWYGRPVIDVIGREIREVLGESGYQTVKEKFDLALSGETVEYEADLEHPATGAPSPRRTIYVPHFGDDGGVEGVFVLSEEIAERRETERALKESEERYRDLFENAPNAYASIDPQEGTVLSFNNALIDLLGYDAAELRGMKVFDFYADTPDGLAKARKMFARLRRGETIEEIELQMRRKSGEPRWVSLSVKQHKDETGRPLENRWIATDITARKQAEEALRESEETLLAFINATTDAAFLADAGGTILAANEVAARIFGRNAADLIGRNGFKLMPAAVRRRWAAWHRQMLETADPIRVTEEFVGAWFENSAYPILDETGKVSRIAVFSRDITDRRNAEENLRRAKEEAEIANRAKSEFLSSMSHELRTPLNGILGFAQLLDHLPDVPLSGKQKEYTDLIIKSGEHLRNLVDQVLELAKIEAGKLEVSVAEVDPKLTVDQSLELVESRALEQGISIDIGYAKKSIPALVTDPLRLQQVMINLISNAIKYNRPGGRVTLDMEDTGRGYLRISVADTGKGISPDQQKGLFKPFDRLGQEGGDVEGTGIGLAITKKIVARLGGSIGFESEENRGSVFWIELPIPGGVKPASSEDRRHCIIYVEDGLSNLPLMQELVGTMTATELMSAHTAEMASDLAETMCADLIVVDVDGLRADPAETITWLRESLSTQDVPVIGLADNATPEEIRKGKEFGYHDIISKPIRVRDFWAAVEAAWNN